jgi:hypothetical protein
LKRDGSRRSSSAADELREFTSGVDTENHTSLAMGLWVLLGAVEPERGGDGDGEVDGRKEVSAACVVEMGEAGVETSLERCAWLCETGLGDGVVGAVEKELDDVSDSSIYLVVLVDEPALASDNNGVSSGRSSSSGWWRRVGSCWWGRRKVRGSWWWWWRRAAGCAGWVGTSDRRVDGGCLAIDNCNRNIDDNHSDCGLFIDCNDAILAWSISSWVDPDRGLGVTIVYGGDRGTLSLDIWGSYVARAAISNWRISLRRAVRGSDSDS